MQPLSPKKYIETKVRSLPIDKCYVNNGWEEAGLANVLIYRRHVNNNVSGAVYLVDLKCLGVKDTMWFFNEAEEDMFEKFAGSGLDFEVIDYEVAHNIVFAGHDFAMDYDIHPHKEFATTRFVLEEDDDRIPLVEITVGEGSENKPHLIEHQQGQYADALAKLKKIAGEGNYDYTFGIGWEDEESEEDDDFLDGYDEDADVGIRLSDVEVDMLEFETVKNVATEDLENMQLVNSRNDFEQMMCMAELLLRIYNEQNLDELVPIDADMMEDAGWETRNAYLNELPEGIDEKTYNNGTAAFRAYCQKNVSNNMNDAQKQNLFESELLAGSGNSFFLVLLFESTFAFPEYALLVLPYLQKYSHLTLPKLVLAFYHLLHQIQDADSQRIIDSPTIKSALPQKAGYDENELCIYYAIQTLRHSLAQNIPAAIANYDHLTETTDTEIHLFLLTPMYKAFLPILQNAVRVNAK
jgi:hypothetical protein